jgi:flagellar motor switch protein FliG
VIDGKRKAAMLLMSLDPGTAAELLKGLNSGTVHDIAVEVAFLEAAGYKAEAHSGPVVKEFCETITKRKETVKARSFLSHMLTSTVGKEKAGEIAAQIQNIVKQRDPFMAIREMSVEKLSAALKGEHPQVAANVMLELPLKKSMEIIATMEEGMRTEAVRRMTNPEAVSWEAKQKIAAMVERKIAAMAEQERARQASAPVAAVTTTTTDDKTPESPLRKVAMMLRGLGKELREGLIKGIEEKSEEAAAGVMDQMLLWEDIPAITDRSLQEGLRGIDSKQLAMAMFKCDERIVRKLRANMSERAAAMIDEEMSFMKDVAKEDLAKAKEATLVVLRDLNKKGQIAFQE